MSNSSDSAPGSVESAVRSPAANGARIDPQAIMAIRNLEMRARVVVEGFWTGLHRSPYHGFSVEFTEYRQYSPGDDTRYLDWRLYARSDRYYIKKFEDETNLRCYLLVDNSRSMGFGTLPHSKAEYANTVAATLAYFLSLQGDAIGLLTFDETIRDFLPARSRSGHLRHLMLALEKPLAGNSTDIGQPLKRIVEIVRKRGLLVLISDLLAPLETLESRLAALTAARHEVVVFQIFDPAELSFNFDKPVLFQDLESGRDLYVDPKDVRADYLRKLQAHNESVQSVCRKLGIGCYTMTTDRPIELALFDFLRDRMQRGKKTKQTALRNS